MRKTAPKLAALLLAGLWAPSLGRAQLTLNVVDSMGEQPAPGVYDLGRIYAGETATALLRLRNPSAAPVTVTLLSVAGVGFSLSGPALPTGLAPGDSLDFTVTFRSTDLGTYSAVLRATGIAILLTATVAPSLTYSVANNGGMLPLDTLDFGSIVRGASAVRRILIQNATPLNLNVPAIGVKGNAFSLTGPPPAGVLLAPQQGTEFSVTFAPPSAGAYTGTLTLGDRNYAIAGLATDPPLPKPIASLSLAQAVSLQQGTLVIRFESPSQSSGSGTATLDFQGPPDPSIAFASGGRSATFPIAPGDQQVLLPFQTGTTAGLLTFTVQMGGFTTRQSLEILAAAPGVTSVQGVRAAGSLQVSITGFDNTRSLSTLAFTFLDAAGNPLAPGAIGSNVAAAFSSYFNASSLGGVFLLNATFPVTGDALQVAACEVGLTNSAGTAKAKRIVF